MTKLIVVLIGLSLAISTTAQDQTVKTLIDRVSETSLQTNLQTIAGPGTDGRMPATKGDELAIQYIAAWFTTHHLTNPLSSSTPFLQSVPLEKLDYENSTLSINGKPVTLHRDWLYFPVESPASVLNAEVVFIGYGLSVPAYDDLKDIDLNGKLVLFKPEAPTDSTGKSWIPDDQVPDETVQSKAIVAKKTLGVLMFLAEPIPGIDSLMRAYKEMFPYIDFRRGNHPLPGAGISKDIANTLVGGDIDSLYNTINQTGKPHSFNTHKKVSLTIVEKADHPHTANIIGLISGTDTTLGAIVITAHHDHLGIQHGKTYFGADDNGSGTVAMLEITKILGDAAAKDIRPRRTLIFVSTAAEEQSLIGSIWYVSHPVVPLPRTSFHINIDMFGRVDSLYTFRGLDSNYVYAIYRNFPADKLKAANDACCRLFLDTFYNKRKTPQSPGIMSRADDLPFLRADIPSLWFFGGYHHDYHEPTDTWDKINYPLLKRRIQLALATIWQLAND